MLQSWHGALQCWCLSPPRFPSKKTTKKLRKPGMYLVFKKKLISSYRSDLYFGIISSWQLSETFNVGKGASWGENEPCPGAYRRMDSCSPWAELSLPNTLRIKHFWNTSVVMVFGEQQRPQCCKGVNRLGKWCDRPGATLSYTRVVEDWSIAKCLSKR